MRKREVRYFDLMTRWDLLGERCRCAKISEGIWRHFALYGCAAFLDECLHKCQLDSNSIQQELRNTFHAKKIIRSCWWWGLCTCRSETICGSILENCAWASSARFFVRLDESYSCVSTESNRKKRFWHNCEHCKSHLLLIRILSHSLRFCCRPPHSLFASLYISSLLQCVTFCR